MNKIMISVHLIVMSYVSSAQPTLRIAEIDSLLSCNTSPSVGFLSDNSIPNAIGVHKFKKVKKFKNHNTLITIKRDNDSKRSSETIHVHNYGYFEIIYYAFKNSLSYGLLYSKVSDSNIPESHSVMEYLIIKNESNKTKIFLNYERINPPDSICVLNSILITDLYNNPLCFYCFSSKEIRKLDIDKSFVSLSSSAFEPKEISILNIENMINIDYSKATVHEYNLCREYFITTIMNSLLHFCM